jgi:hypothetical protein
MVLDPIDQRVRDAGFNFVPFNRFLASPFQIPQDDDDTDPNTGGGLTTLPVRDGGRGSGNVFSGGINDLMSNMNIANRNRYFDNQPTPLVDNLRQSQLDKTFMGFPSYKEIDPIGPFTPYSQPMNMSDPGASIENIIASQNVPLELTKAGQLQQQLGNAKKGIANLAEKFGGFGPVSAILGSMDRFNTLSPYDQEFIKQNMGYTGPTVFGENPTGNPKDIFGINTRSAFGNYADFVGKKSKELAEALSPTGVIGSKKAFSGATFNELTGKFESDTLSDEELDDLNRRTNIVRGQFSLYNKKEEERLLNEELMKEQEEKALKDQQAIDEAAYRDQPGEYGGDNRQQEREEAGPGYSGSGTAAEMGSFARGGRVYYMDGGLADMLEIYD